MSSVLNEDHKEIVSEYKKTRLPKTGQIFAKLNNVREPLSRKLNALKVLPYFIFHPFLHSYTLSSLFLPCFILQIFYKELEYILRMYISIGIKFTY